MANGQPYYRNRSAKVPTQVNIGCTGAVTGAIVLAENLPTGSGAGDQINRPVVMRLSGFADDITWGIYTDVSGTTVAGPFTCVESVVFHFDGQDGFCAGNLDEGLYISGSGGGSLQCTADIVYEHE